MNYKLFGNTTGLSASELILGSAMLGNRSGYGSPPDEAKDILHGFADAGGNFIDTSDQYQLGEAEELIGKFIAHDRNNYIICTKYTRSNEASPAKSKMGNHRKAMIQAVEGSLKRLQTDHIDIYMPHYDDGITPLEEIVRGLDDLISAGKIIYAGLANFPAWKAATIATHALQKKAPIAALQLEYNLLQRAPDRELLPMAAHFGMGCMLYSPLAGGLLTGKYRKGETGRMTRMKKTNGETPVIKTVLNALQTIAEELNALPAHVALAWAMATGAFPIIGARTLEQLENNLKATEVKLSVEHLRLLNELSAIDLGYPHDLLAAQKTQS